MVSTYTAFKYLLSVRWCHVSGPLFIELIVSNVSSRRGATRLRGHIKTESLLILTNQGGKLETRGPTWTSKAKPTHSNPHIIYFAQEPFQSVLSDHTNNPYCNKEGGHDGIWLCFNHATERSGVGEGLPWQRELTKKGKRKLPHFFLYQ